jgi:hypothetical protein
MRTSSGATPAPAGCCGTPDVLLLLPIWLLLLLLLLGFAMLSGSSPSCCSVVRCHCLRPSTALPVGGSSPPTKW